MDLFELTVTQAASQIANRKLSPVLLMESLLGRIERLEPSLKAWVTLDPEASMDAARASEETLVKSGPQGPLHGVPVGVKDIFYTEGIRTTACSEVYADLVPTYDAACLSRLKASGAIMLGKTVTTPYAASDPSPTVNPWNPKHTPGGSSSGSGVAVAARMCPAALGSQTVGSTLRPAAYNGIVGLKPTYGRISLRGVIPLAWSLDTVGILARSVEDTALLLQVMAGHDPEDPASSTELTSNYLSGLKSYKHPPRIGLVRDFFYPLAQDQVRAHTDAVAQQLAKVGAIIKEVKLPGIFDDHDDAGRTTFHVEAATVHHANFKADPSKYPPLIRNLIEQGQSTSAVQYARAQRIRIEFRHQMHEILKDIDVLMTPTTPTAAPQDLTTTGDRAFQGPWTTAGLPTITIPTGIDSQGMPLGIQLISSWFTEKRLLAIANWCHQNFPFKAVPPLL